MACPCQCQCQCTHRCPITHRRVQNSLVRKQLATARVQLRSTTVVHLLHQKLPTLSTHHAFTNHLPGCVLALQARTAPSKTKPIGTVMLRHHRKPQAAVARAPTHSTACQMIMPACPCLQRKGVAAWAAMALSMSTTRLCAECHPVLRLWLLALVLIRCTTPTLLWRVGKAAGSARKWTRAALAVEVAVKIEAFRSRSCQMLGVMGTQLGKLRRRRVTPGGGSRADRLDLIDGSFGLYGIPMPCDLLLPILCLQRRVAISFFVVAIYGVV
jgi:hypothetical protein